MHITSPHLELDEYHSNVMIEVLELVKLTTALAPWALMRALRKTVAPELSLFLLLFWLPQFLFPLQISFRLLIFSSLFVTDY
ncbi:unnamed protein product [Gongylonema pulchrum]|uniref:Uncharacterized protein n=1 Tax=Gongylonema pulchrum TaxID=637853 RepID=A0A183EQQ5_9BILA|nr:unnamed protein product [Gongylonema pulchrum]